MLPPRRMLADIGLDRDLDAMRQPCHRAAAHLACTRPPDLLLLADPAATLTGLQLNVDHIVLLLQQGLD